jgi:hypothetical protein
VSISTARAGWSKELWRLGLIDFVQVHVYGPATGTLVPGAIAEVSPLAKPIWVTEFGRGTSPADDIGDPSGESLHAGLWAGALTEAAGAPLPWWWDTHVELFKLYPNFEALARFTSGDDRRGRPLRPVRREFQVADGQRVAVVGLMDHTGGWFWVYDPARVANPGRPALAKTVPAPLEVELEGLLDGEYEVEYWDTLTGRITGRARVTARGSIAAFSVPESERDLAIKVIPVGGRRPGIRGEAGAEMNGALTPRGLASRAVHSRWPRGGAAGSEARPWSGPGS